MEVHIDQLIGEINIITEDGKITVKQVEDIKIAAMNSIANALKDALPDPNCMILEKYHALLKDPRIGSVYQIEAPIQDVGEYELVLTLKLK